VSHPSPGWVAAKGEGSVGESASPRGPDAGESPQNPTPGRAGSGRSSAKTGEKPGKNWG